MLSLCFVLNDVVNCIVAYEGGHRYRSDSSSGLLEKLSVFERL